MPNSPIHNSWYFPIVICFKALFISICFGLLQVLGVSIAYAAPPDKAVTDYEIDIATQAQVLKEQQEAAELAQWEYEQSRGRLVQLDTSVRSYFDDTFGATSCSPTCVFTDLESTAYLKSSGWFDGNEKPDTGITYKLVFKYGHKKKYNIVELYYDGQIVSSLKLGAKYRDSFPTPSGGMVVVTSTKKNRVKVYKLNVTPNEKKKLKTTLLLDVEGIRPKFYAGIGTDTLFTLNQQDEETGRHSNHIYNFNSLGALVSERRDKAYVGSHVIKGFASNKRGFLTCTSKHYGKVGMLSYYNVNWEQAWSVDIEQCGMVVALEGGAFFAQVKETDGYSKSAYSKISSSGSIQWQQTYDTIYGDFSDPYYNENGSLTVRSLRGFKPYFLDIQNVNFD